MAGLRKRIFFHLLLATWILLAGQNAFGYQINLSPRWNLISLHEQPANTAIEQVTNSIAGKFNSVWSYDNGAWKLYKPSAPAFSDLLTMEAGRGYWIDMNEAGTLSGSGTTSASQVSLKAGWNLVGYSCKSIGIADALSTIADKYESVWAFKGGVWKLYDPANPVFSDLASMDPDSGYWIKAKEAAAWTCPNDFVPRPVVPGETTPESSGQVSLTNTSPVVGLTDGTQISLGGLGEGESVDLVLERVTNTVTTGSTEIVVSGSLRKLTVNAVTNNPGGESGAFSPVVTIPQKEIGLLNADYVNIMRITYNPDTGEEERVFFPVVQNQNGDLTFRDWMLPTDILEEDEPSAATGRSSLRVGASGPKVIRYSAVSIQNLENVAVSPKLVRMLPAKGHEWRRRPFAGLPEEELKKPVQNVVIFVHGHNEMEKTGYEVKNSAPPWSYDYKKDVWNYMYEKFSKDFSDREGCTVFYEFIYPSWRSIYHHLNGELARLVNEEFAPQLKNGMKFNLFVVAHSMGGLVARAGLMLFESQLKDNLQRLVTWGSPHHGSPLNSLRFALSSPALASRQNTVITKAVRFSVEKGIVATQGVLDCEWTDDLLNAAGKYVRLSLDKVFRWYGDSTDPNAWDRWNTGSGSMLYNRDVYLLNSSDDMGSKYAFLYGITNEGLKLKDWSEFGLAVLWDQFMNLSDIGKGATLEYMLIEDPSYPFMGADLGDTDGVAPVISMAGSGVAGSAPYVGSIDHEQYFNSPVYGPITASKTYEAMDFGNDKYDCPEVKLTSPAKGQTFPLGAQVPIAGQLVWPGDNKPGNRIKQIRVESFSSKKNIILSAPAIDEQGNFTGEFPAADLADTGAPYLAASALTVVLQFKDDTELAVSVWKLVVNSVSCDYAPPQARVYISGEGFGATQGSSTITLNGVALTSIERWYDTSISLLLPVDAISGDIVVTVNGVKSNAYPYVIDTQFGSKLAERPNTWLFIDADPMPWCTAPPVTAMVLWYSTEVNDPDLILSQTTPGRISGSYHKTKTYQGTVNCTHTWDISFEDLPLIKWCTCYTNCSELLGCEEEYCADPPSFEYWDQRNPKNKIVYRWSYACDDGTSWSFNSEDCHDGYRISASVTFSRE